MYTNCIISGQIPVLLIVIINNRQIIYSEFILWLGLNHSQTPFEPHQNRYADTLIRQRRLSQSIAVQNAPSAPFLSFSSPSASSRWLPIFTHYAALQPSDSTLTSGFSVFKIVSFVAATRGKVQSSLHTRYSLFLPAFCASCNFSPRCPFIGPFSLSILLTLSQSSTPESQGWHPSTTCKFRDRVQILVVCGSCFIVGDCFLLLFLSLRSISLDFLIVCIVVSHFPYNWFVWTISHMAYVLFEVTSVISFFILCFIIVCRSMMVELLT